MRGRKVFVVGIGMTKFEKPFSKEWSYIDMVSEEGSGKVRTGAVANHRAQ